MAGLLAAHHEADLAGRVRRDCCVCVLSHREDLAAVLLQLGDEGQVKPLVLGCGMDGGLANYILMN